MLGYGFAQGPKRILASNATVNATDPEINSTGVAGLAVGIFISIITALGFIMMGNIQTPKSFAKKDLIKGRINK